MSSVRPRAVPVVKVVTKFAAVTVRPKMARAKFVAVAVAARVALAVPVATAVAQAAVALVVPEVLVASTVPRHMPSVRRRFLLRTSSRKSVSAKTRRIN